MTTQPSEAGSHAAELFPAAYPQCSITVQALHPASGHIFTLTFNDLAFEKVLRALAMRGLEPLDRAVAAASATPAPAGPAKPPLCLNPNCSAVGKPLVVGQFGLRCNGKDALTGNQKGYCKSQA